MKTKIMPGQGFFIFAFVVYVGYASAQCSDQCVATIVESIPDNLTYADGSPTFPSTYSAWNNLIEMATTSIHLASYYWTLRYKGDVLPISLDDEGEAIFNGLMAAGLNRSIEILIAQNQPDSYDPDIDSFELAAKGAAQVRSLNFPALIGGDGILHTKFWVVDSKHVYIGSANFDWESLTQVKELGLMLYNCSCLAEDLDKIFQIYWLLGAPNATVPPEYPPEYETQFNKTNPFSVLLNNTQSQVYFGSSPPPFCTAQRTGDLDAILTLMDAAEQFVYISVMDYYPLTIYTPTYQFWPDIDNKIRAIAIDKAVKVRMLISNWNHSHHDEAFYLNSLQVITNTYDNVDVEVKIFVVPAFTEIQSKITYGRVNHAKYMVTDNAAYIGTSNWSGDYFTDTGGASVIVNQTNPNDPIREQLQSIFERDWNSEYVHPVTDFLSKTNCLHN